MALSLRDCTFFGSALSESFALNDLEGVLAKERLLEKPSGSARRELDEGWESFRRKLRALGDQGGALRVRHHVLDPLAERLGYGAPQAAGNVMTRETDEDGGFVYATADGAKLRAWAVDLGTDLDAPNQRGRAYRFSPARVAERVLLAAGERVGLLTDGDELRVVIVDPARPGSHVAIALGRSSGWRGSSAVPDSYRVVRSLASPAGVARIGAITEAARLAQTRVTKSLRDQARRAVEVFVQSLLDAPANAVTLAECTDAEGLARTLWREGLVVVYRLLFILKLEASADPARAFSFASTSLWRNTYSPNVALAPVVKDVVERGAVTGSFLADTLRATFRLFSEGLVSSELKVSPLGGMLFGADSTPLVSRLVWTEEGVAALLDNLLWTRERGQDSRARVHYGSLDVEDLGRVYEALLELEPGLADRPMCRLRRAKLEVVVDASKAEPYRAAARPDGDEAEGDDADEDSGDDEAPQRGKAKTVWVEDIAKGRFFLRVGLGRKATGSYYTPHPFVRFLVQETLAPQVAERSPAGDPKPGAILKLKVLDPAMGSGHFLVEACRFLGEKLYEATRLCDGLAADAERAAAASKEAADREHLLGRARELRYRVEELPDPNDELVAYLPSRAAEGGDSGLSQTRALAICRRLVAVHCLYGVDKNPLAVELAKVSLWLESYAEGLPLTFLDHRLVCGDSLVGPGFSQMLKLPILETGFEPLFAQHLAERLKGVLSEALVHSQDLESTVGKDISDIENKRQAKARLDNALAPLQLLARMWSGAVILGAGAGGDDSEYQVAAQKVAAAGGIPELSPAAEQMKAAGAEAISYELVFPEVFFPDGDASRRAGFAAVLGNPPWDAIKTDSGEFFASYDIGYLELRSKVERATLQQRLLGRDEIARAYRAYLGSTEGLQRVHDRLFVHQREMVGDAATSRQLDSFRLFTELSWSLLKQGGAAGLVLPSGFHNNSGAVSVRKLLVRESRLSNVLVFDNSRRLFDIATHLKFDIVTFRKGQPGDEIGYACGLQDPGILFSGETFVAPLPVKAVRDLSPDYWAFPEFRSPADLQITLGMARTGVRFAEWAAACSIAIQRELNMDAGRSAILPGPGGCPILRGSELSFYQADVERAEYHGTAASAAKYAGRITSYRIALKRIVTVAARGKVVGALLPPGVLTTAYGESEPSNRANALALGALGVLNSCLVDYLLGPRVKATLNLFMLDDLPWPRECPTFLVHAALRLSCMSGLYEGLWREQLGSAWREEGSPFTWPVLRGDDARTALRTNVDAVVASMYGLDRTQYAHVLGSFGTGEFRGFADLCLNAFDELAALGVADFARAHDPYWDVPVPFGLEAPAGIPQGEEEADRSSGQLALGGVVLSGRQRESNAGATKRKGSRKLR